MPDDMDVDENRRGVKRKVDETRTSSEAPRRIRALEQDVVNKIAAGEIIVAPVHALKELIENAVDAGSTSLEILVKDGGLKLLQITDNGHGINRDDLPILCERFTTSKLKAFEDLSSIGTYGFRGEALASISHIAHLTVTTKTQESSCAWRAQFSDGGLVPPKPGHSAEPKAVAGRPGTQITVEDLFYNVPTRRRAFRSASEEYAKIVDLVGRYAVHCSNVAFSCKKHGESAAGVSVPGNASTIDRIRIVHTSQVANELLRLEIANERWGFQAEGWVSNANYSVKRTTLLLFINHRAVESSNIKKAVEQTYSNFLPKGGHPFIYISLEIDPQRVDVNVHPTKREVNFLNEDEIIEDICTEIRSNLGKVDTSRTFMTQSILPAVKAPTVAMSKPEPTEGAKVSDRRSREITTTRKISAPKVTPQRPYENNLVRTDAKVRKITSMLPVDQGSISPTKGGDEETPEDMQYEYSDKEPIICRLTTVKQLRAEVRDNMHNELTDVFSSHTFIGIVDSGRRIVAVQGGVKLFLVDYGMVSNEYFYQIGLTDFGNFGCIRFDPALDLEELLRMAASQEQERAQDTDDLDWSKVVQTVKDQLISRREMLAEYFSFEVSERGELLGIPLLVKSYMPCMAKLPGFLLRLGPYVDWTDEKGCFHSFLRELASFYVPEVLPSSPSSVDGQGAILDPEIAARKKHIDKAIENILFPAFKSRLVATRGLLKGVVEVANLKGLYRVFERC
ncbi:MAG: hypothetical protein Q9165_005514 [Trypethelium subeluteriae]